MSRKGLCFLICMFFCCATLCAQQTAKSELHQRAETEEKNGNLIPARYNYLRAFEDYSNHGQPKESVMCGVKATEMYYQKENLYKEAFELLHRVEAVITASKLDAGNKAALQYQVTKQRLQMYMKLRKSDSANAQLRILESQAAASGDEEVKNDLLYTKAIFFYTFGQNEKGNAVFKEMAVKLTAQKDYGKVDEVYQTLIANGRRSNNVNMVAQSYKNYIAWKDSVNAIQKADEIGALKEIITTGEAIIAEKDSLLTTRKGIITALCILAVVLATLLVVGSIVMARFIFLIRKQKKTIRLANENNALKAKFISNISAQLTPTLQKLNSSVPEVKAIRDFSEHIQTLADLDKTIDEPVELDEVQVLSFSKGIVDTIRDKVKANVTVTTDVPNMSARINKEYVSHILLHLLQNAADFTPEGGHISLEFKKRSAHKFQFLVSNTGPVIPEDHREDVFKPFLEIRNLTTGDGLGLPICKQMALKMRGDLEIDSAYTRGTRFVLSLFE